MALNSSLHFCRRAWIQPPEHNLKPNEKSSVREKNLKFFDKNLCSNSTTRGLPDFLESVDQNDGPKPALVRPLGLSVRANQAMQTTLFEVEVVSEQIKLNITRFYKE